MKKILTVSIIIIAALLSGCGNAEKTEPTTTFRSPIPTAVTPSKEPKTIKKPVATKKPVVTKRPQVTPVAKATITPNPSGEEESGSEATHQNGGGEIMTPAATPEPAYEYTATPTAQPKTRPEDTNPNGYDMSNYSDGEDLYDDYEDDFEDEEEAEDYYDDYGE